MSQFKKTIPVVPPPVTALVRRMNRENLLPLLRLSAQRRAARLALPLASWQPGAAVSVAVLAQRQSGGPGAARPFVS